MRGSWTETARSCRSAALALLVLAGCAAPAAAQLRPSALSLGARALAARPVADWRPLVGGGRGFGVDAGYDVRPGFTVYLGYSRTAFPDEQGSLGHPPVDLVDSGLDFGLLTRRTVARVPLWFRAGAVLHEAERHRDGEGLDDGTTGLGLESGIGIAVRLGRRAELLPGVVYAAYPEDGRGGVTHLRAEAAVRLRP